MEKRLSGHDKLVIAVDYPSRIPSINAAYFRSKSGHVVLTDEARNYKQSLKVAMGGLIEKIDWLDYPFLLLNSWRKLDLYFILSGTEKSFRSRDVSNLIKLTEDAFKDWIGVDDSNHLTVSATKLYNPYIRTEQIIFEYSNSNIKWKLSKPIRTG
jgi:hypothetical protein